MARMGHSTPHAEQVHMHATAERGAVLAESLGALMSFNRWGLRRG